MRLLFIFLASMVAAISSSAQLSSSPDTTVYSCISEGLTNLHYDIVNNFSTDEEIYWEVTAIDMPMGWSVATICDNALCLTNIQVGTSSTSFPVVANTAMDLKVTYDLESTADDGVGIVVIACSANGSNLNAVYQAYTCPLELGIIETSDFYVNYQEGQITLVRGDDNTSKSYRIYNIYGQQVHQGRLSSSIVTIPFENRMPSVYIIQVLDKDGQSVGVKKISNL